MNPGLLKPVGRTAAAALIACVIYLLIQATGSFAQTSQPAEQSAVNAESGEQYKKGIRLFGEGKYSEAFSFFQTAYESDTSNTAACFAMGLSRYREKKFIDAAGHFKRVLEVNPDHIKALRTYPAALFNAGEFEQAAAAYDISIAKEPENHVLYTGKARALAKLSRHGDALGFFQKALELSPTDTSYKYLYAQTLAETGKLKEASEMALEIPAGDPSHARARIITADYLRMSGKLTEALTHYKTAAQDPETRKYAEYYIGEIEFELEEREIEREWEKSRELPGK